MITAAVIMTTIAAAIATVDPTCKKAVCTSGAGRFFYAFLVDNATLFG